MCSSRPCCAKTASHDCPWHVHNLTCHASALRAPVRMRALRQVEDHEEEEEVLDRSTVKRLAEIAKQREDKKQKRKRGKDSSKLQE